jgi:RNA recognition motif-containing protein
VPPLVPHEELLQLFGKFGTVLDLNLFKRWSTAKASKGCGTVKYSTSEAASAALLALNGVHTFEAHQGCEGPMVVEWMDASRLTSADAAGALAAAGPTRMQGLPPLNSASEVDSTHSFTHMHAVGFMKGSRSLVPVTGRRLHAPRTAN